ncbi:MAG: hypothetical protein QOI95_3179 [Acidimicrobiaceae bacterium]|jgi:hypothetical protein
MDDTGVVSEPAGLALTIGGATPGRLTFSERSPLSGAVVSCLATLELPDQMVARMRVDESGGTFFVGLVEMFDDLAADWRRARGELSWGSLEGELGLVSSADSLGHITFAVWLTIDPVVPWRVHGAVVVEAGALEGLAQEAHGFFRH